MSDTLATSSQPLEEYSYDDDVTRYFVIATLFWGVVALLLGVVIASQLADWRLNFGIPWLTFGRLRPLHTNAAIFAFAGNAIFAGIYHSTQRLLKTRMYSDLLSRIHFWGWQALIVAAAITLPLGFSVGKEYAELEWPLAQAVNVIWVVFGVNFFLTLRCRRVRHLYVAVWFYIATVVTVALLHVINTINIPVSLLKSYPIYAGVQDALVQWWYGHNAVAFVLTTPFLGLMYYYLPKAADRPVYSYRLSIVHFWSLVFIYIWAGPHHLLYTALPEWAQTLGMVFSVMLLAPSWGGMINGLLTLRGAWHKVRTDPVLKFFVAGLTFYGMATFEGPLLSIKSMSAVAHYTDWIIAHVHAGALGWNGFVAFAMIYWLVPRLWKASLYSVALANAHFWLGTLGIVLYVLSMWIAGVTQGLMLGGTEAETGRLLYPDFVETLVRIVPLYRVRALGGAIYLFGLLLMVYNVFRTIRAAPARGPEEVFAAPSLRPDAPAAIVGAFVSGGKPHRLLEGLPTVFTVLTLGSVAVGTVIELLPALVANDYAPSADYVRPYTPLQLAGRDIYVREGCYNCHSQMIRPISSEVLRYGAPSKVEESRFDYPFQWGSKRTGPDLARIGGKYPDLWHYRHLADPREIVPSSLMPSYPWLLKRRTDFDSLSGKLRAMRRLGVPYSEEEVGRAAKDARAEAAAAADTLRSQAGGEGLAGIEDKEILAVIAYLQRLGSDARREAERAQVEARSQKPEGSAP
jgi:cytochrome c oxidase cbb3-type subunit I/II